MQCDLRSYKILGLFSSDQLIGYVIVYAAVNQQLRVADLLIDPAHGPDDLLPGLIHWARENRFDSVAVDFSGVPGLAESLHRFGFQSRPSTAKLTVITHNAELSQSMSNWYMLPGDEDYN